MSGAMSGSSVSSLVRTSAAFRGIGDAATSGGDAATTSRVSQRRHVAISHTQAQTIRNKRLLTEKDPGVRQRNHDELRRMAEDPKLAREFLLRSSLIESLREAEQIA